MNDTDIKRAKQIASYPWFATKKPWQKEIERMLKNGFKLEVESLISKDISYVTETYVPQLVAGKRLAGLAHLFVCRSELDRHFVVGEFGFWEYCADGRRPIAFSSSYSELM